MPPELTMGRRVDAPKRQSPSTSDSESQVSSLRLHVTCVVMALIAAFIFTLTEHDDHEHSLWCAFEIAIQTLLVIVATCYFRMRIRLLHESSVIMPILVMVACFSLVCEPFQRMVFETGHSFEMLVMHSQCNLMLALAVCGFRLSFQRLAAIIAVFTTLFCCTISSASGLIPLTIIFAVSTIVWLVASWWETVDRRVLQTTRRGFPVRLLLTGGAVPLLALLAANAFGANQVTTALSGFMPSSGGTGEHSPYARGGVRDGEALIAGNENIKSFAPIDDAPFLDSELPSLYDVFNDTFDDPVKKIKHQERAVSLPADLMKHIHQIMAEAKKAGREFDLLRSRKQGDKSRIRDLDTHALFYVAGRTPVHLKMEVFQLFDGRKWTADVGEWTQRLPMKETDGRHWLNIPQPGKGFGMFSGTATHSIKVANLDGNVIPTPAHPVGVSIDLVDVEDMYRVYSNGLVTLNRKSVPTMTPISFVSRCVDRSALRDNDRISILKRTQMRSVDDLYTYMPDADEADRIRRLTERCVAGIPRGWRQIEVIEQFLRTNYKLDRDSLLSDEETQAISTFLFETKRGPEYLFASSAVMMLRSLGYRARLVSGFYARPERYDVKNRHTAVLAKDAHFWCEVTLGAGAWLTVEPSPGYEILPPPPGIWEQLSELLALVWGFVVRNAIALTLLSVGGIFCFLWRRSIQDRLLTLRWRMAFRRKANRRAVHLAVLVEHRLRLAGLEKEAGTTLRRWSSKAVFGPVRDRLKRVAEIADQAMYQSDDVSVDDRELNELAQALSYRQLKRLPSSAGNVSQIA